MKFIALALILISCAGCAKADVFSDIGTNIADPSSMWIDVASNRLYLVNSNSKVLYDSTQGSFQVYDISNPLAPVLLNTLETLSFSGEIYVDTVAKFAYIPNRYTASESAVEDILYRINIDEASADYLSTSTSPLGADSFAIKCCYPADRAWITTRINQLDYVDLAGDRSPGAVSLLTSLDTGEEITDAATDHIAIINNQAFLTLENGGVEVVNLDEAGDPNAKPVDYFIADIGTPRGIATDGTWLYVVGEGEINGTWTRFLMILDPSSLTPNTANANTHVVYISDPGILLATVTVGEFPQEVIVSQDYAFVTNQGSDTVSVINIDSAVRAWVKDITVGDEPFSLALYTTLAGDDKYVYVGNASSNTISIIDIDTLTVAQTYP